MQWCKIDELLVVADNAEDLIECTTVLTEIATGHGEKEGFQIAQAITTGSNGVFLNEKIISFTLINFNIPVYINRFLLLKLHNFYKF